MISKEDVMERVVQALAQREDVFGVAVVGDGINLQFDGDRTWWRLDVRDVTALLDAEATKRVVTGF